MRDRVAHLRNQFTETSLRIVGNKLSAMNVSYRATTNSFTSCGVVIGRSPRFNNRGSYATMRPSRCTERMVMPKHQSYINFNPPTITDILSRDNLSCLMSMCHTFGKCDGIFSVFCWTFIWIRFNTFNPTCILTIRHLYTDNDVSTNMVSW